MADGGRSEINPKVTAATIGAAGGGGIGGAVAVIVLYLIDPGGTLPEQVSSAINLLISAVVAGVLSAGGAFFAGYARKAPPGG